jgi:hypothetical protein
VLLAHAIDYAGLYPPAALPEPQVRANYAAYAEGPHAHFLNRLVLPPDTVIEGSAERAGDRVYREQGDADFAKIRTGGLTADKIPSIEAVAAFLRENARKRRAFKATAGLHHAVRGEYALTYAADSPRAVMHGFLNVFLAAVFAWHGRDAILEGVLGETDPAAFRFSDSEAGWREHPVTTAQIAEARRDFLHSFGSCSFEEPVQELIKLGLMG